jgi:hypothetical protein
MRWQRPFVSNDSIYVALHIKNVGCMQCSESYSMSPFIIQHPIIAVILVFEYLLEPHAHMAVSVGHILPAKQCHVNMLILRVN